VCGGALNHGLRYRSDHSIRKLRLDDRLAGDAGIGGIVPTDSGLRDDGAAELLRATVPSLIHAWEPPLNVRVSRFYVQHMKTKWGICNPATRAILSLSETLYGWRGVANRVMLVPDGRRSYIAVDCIDQLISLKGTA